jgi:hypothetical protein
MPRPGRRGAIGFAPAWELLRDFNSGTVNASVQGQVDGMDDIAGASVYTTEQVYAGTRSMKTTITSGSDGFGLFGGTITLPSTLSKGNTLWLDLYAYFPTGFIIDTPTNGSLKFVRIRQRTAASTHVGYFDLSLCDDDSPDGPYQYRMIKEDTSGWVYSGAAGLMTRNAWHRVSLHIVFDNVLQASGGTARVRVWHNGTLLVDNTTIRTLLNATDVASDFYLFTYWNGTAPQTQACYIDNIRIAKNGVPSWAATLPGV